MDKTKAELIRENVLLKLENRRLQHSLNGSKRNIYRRFKLSLFAFFREWRAV